MFRRSTSLILPPLLALLFIAALPAHSIRLDIPDIKVLAAAGAAHSAHALFAPGTDPAYIAQIEALMNPGGTDRHNFYRHWIAGSTAANEGGSNVGDPLTLTWSIVPDGTVIPGGISGAGEAACDSNLHATMNARYGAGIWQAEIQEVFDEWASLSGNIYIHEPNDDGASWPGSRGALGVRGDIRISGCRIDGNSRILAYNFFPSTGDMKIDSTDSFFDSPLGSVGTGFHYVVAHEHGHGVGLLHVCPVNATKLMEPTINVGFNTLRHDDIRGAQRGYGDNYELPAKPNDSAAGAFELGTLFVGQELNLTPLSIDDDSDQDWFRFTVGADRELDVTLVPTGHTYEDGDQDPSTAECLPGPTINSKTIHDLNFEIRDSDGVTVLAAGNTTAAGISEVVNDLVLRQGGVRYLRVYPATTTNDVQLYDLSIKVEQAVVPTVAVTPQIGRAGTLFTVELSDYPPNTDVEVKVNGRDLGSVSTDGAGGAQFGLDSTNAGDGHYHVTAVNGADRRSAPFIVSASAPLVGGSTAMVFPIPPGIGFRALYLPAARR